MLRSLNKYLLIIGFGLISCSHMNHDKEKKKDIDNGNEQTFYLHTSLKALDVGNSYVFCDTSLKEEMSCFVNYNGNRYLKKEKIFYDSIGGIEKVILYKSEGTIDYYRKDLMSDSLLVQANMWKLEGNTLKMKGDSVVYPISSKIIEFNKATKKIYCILKEAEVEKEQLYIFEFR